MILYRVGGRPNALRYRNARAGGDALDDIRRAYAERYWRPESAKERKALKKAERQWVRHLIGGMKRFIKLNGRIVRERHGRSIPRQLADQLFYYRRYGILPRWYYIFSLYEPDGRSRARAYINRFETKWAGGVYDLVNAGARSPLNDKLAFAAFCREHDLPAVPVLAALGELTAGTDSLPRADLFMKPVSGRGGRGAERWDYLASDRYERTDGKVATGAELIAASEGRLIQPRVVADPSLADLSKGALTTLRVLTCLNEQRQPEVVAAVFRMAIGANVTVDNIHAGGMAAPVDLQSGTLGEASNLGEDVRLGWHETHPDTGGRIAGRVLPMWDEACALAKKAHLAFNDRVVVGWDIALLEDGPCLVEGNGSPDVDLMQRPLRRGLGDGRFGELLAFHLNARRDARAKR